MAAVELEIPEDNIAGVTLNRPDRLNAIDGSLIKAMDEALDALSSGEFRAAMAHREKRAPVWDPM